jgi:hypothetical protein
VLVALAVALSSLTACGGNNASVPPELLAAIAKQGGATPAAGYPAGPYGKRVGDTVQDLCFDGWTDPTAESFDPAKIHPICLSDFHAETDVKLLLVESCAVWCVSCKSEYRGSTDRPSLTDALAARRSQGFRVLGTLFQDGASRPATPADAAAWAEAYGVTFPFTIDDEHKIGLFTSPNTAPFNLLIDTRTMKLVLALAGDEPAVLFAAMDDFLAKLAK